MRSPALRRHGPLCLALLLLALLWVGPLPARAETSFAAHMVLHMGVVALAAPLLAFSLGRSGLLPASAGTGRFVLPAALLEFLLIWGWHAPALHDAARQHLGLFALEQGSFLLAGLFLWTTALGSLGSPQTGARAAGAAGLLLTSMHMTLLGALLLLAPRPLYRCGTLCSPLATLTPLEDQQLGGTLMLLVGGAAYLAGGIALLAGVLRAGDGTSGQRMVERFSFDHEERSAVDAGGIGEHSGRSERRKYPTSRPREVSAPALSIPEAEARP